MLMLTRSTMRLSPTANSLKSYKKLISAFSLSSKFSHLCGVFVMPDFDRASLFGEIPDQVGNDEVQVGNAPSI